MAPKKNKGPKAQNANSGSAPQGNPPKSQKSKASRSQAPQPKPKPKPAGTRTSTKKTDQSHQAKATTTTIPAPKTAVEVSKDDKISGQVQSSTKKRKHQPAMAHGSKKNNAPPGRDPRTAQLELPEGYIHPKDQSKKNNRRNRGKKAIEVSPPPPGPVLPWVLNPKFPKPLGRNCNFKYDRDRWRSLAGKDVESEMEKQFTRSRRIGLRPPSLQMNEEQLKQLHGKYWQEREVELFKIRKAVMNKSGSPKLFIVSSGPYYQGFNPVNVEKSPLVRFMQVPELGKMVLDRLLPSIGDLTALAATCKIAAASVRESIESWDFTANYFPTDEFCEKWDSKTGRLLQSGGVRTNTLVISPVSNEWKTEALYTVDFERVRTLCTAMCKIPLSFRSIVLDRIPMLNVKAFELIVNTMPNLRAVTITRCVMLDVTKLKPLLDVIRRHPRRLKGSGDDAMPRNPQAGSPADELDDAAEPRQAEACASGSSEHEHAQAAAGKEQGPKEYIKLDFFPFFFHGPDSATRLGSYGVTWNEPTFDTPKAIFSLILRCWSLAAEVGMDLVSDSSSFWSFVRRLPGPDVLWTMKAREALLTREYEYSRGIKGRAAIDEKFADDLTAALMGDNQIHPTIPLRMARRLPDDHLMDGPYWRKTFVCNMCHFRYPRSLFPMRIDTCWSCKMELFVDYMEDSHLRLWQESAMDKWLRGLNPRTSNLGRLLDKSRELCSRRAVREINHGDFTRDYFLCYYDRDEKVTKPPLRMGDPATIKLIEMEFCPPPPKSLDRGRAAMARWRWYRSPATAAFDYLQGGPQCVHPCKGAGSVSEMTDPNFGPESKASFRRCWEGTDYSDMKNAWLGQNRADREAYRRHHPRVEDALFSFSTPGRVAYNLDQPIPDPGLNPVEYNQAVMALAWNSIPYGAHRGGF